MVQFTTTGDWSKTAKFLSFIRRGGQYDSLDGFAQRGVEALKSVTPTSTGLTAASWSYEIERKASGVRITWKNSNIHNGFPVAVMLQYGHGTGTGGYVQGQDYINPAIRPIFDEIAQHVWKAVTSA